ncbi:g11247 [Coccomyxa viridis]|uniref:G11247 protein n=1 Tax=Coccomyxa viridis TaxID=1274662 RepID=A0ABP1G7I8_9CHLO
MALQVVSAGQHLLSAEQRPLQAKCRTQPNIGRSTGARSTTKAIHRGSLGSQGPSKGSQSRSGVQNREEYLQKLQAARSSLETQEVQQQKQQQQKLRDGTGGVDSGDVLAVDATSSLDVLGSMDGLSSSDAVEVLKASLAAEPAAESDVGTHGAAETEAPGALLGMSTAVQGMILLNISAALFGSNQVVIKLAEHDISVSALSALRFGIAALCFAPAAVRGLRNKEMRLTALELGMWLFGGYTAQAIGLEYTTASRGAFTGTFTVLAVPLLVGLSGRKVPWTTWAAAAVALTGVGLLTTSGVDPNIGDALCIGSATLFGVHKWRSETVTAQFKDNTNELIAVQLLALASAASLFAAPEMLQLAAQGPDAVVSAAMGLPWVNLLFMGLGTTAFTLWVEMHALKTVSAPLAALIYTSEPLWGAMFAWVLLSERWGPTGWVGASLIVASTAASQLVNSRSKAKQA